MFGRGLVTKAAAAVGGRTAAASVSPRRDRGMTASEVAASILWPARVVSLRADEVEGGLANGGCLVHVAEGADGREARFFEKRTSLAREVAFSLRTAPSYAGAGRRMLPRIYGVRPGAEHASVFMEFVEGIGAPFERTAEAARALADGVALVSTATGRAPRAPVVISEGMTERFAESAADLVAEADAGTREAFEALRGSVADVRRAIVRRLAMLPSHNDIYVPNMAMVREDGGALRARFVDWGKYGANFVGADFHHFWREATFNRRDRTFIDQALGDYVAAMARRGHALEIADVELGASHYALQRAINRFPKRRSAEEFRRVLALHAIVRDQLAGATAG